jgi:hypothetical protein
MDNGLSEQFNLICFTQICVNQSLLQKWIEVFFIVSTVV